MFVATHLIGGVAVCLNAWLPLKSLEYCLNVVKPDLVFVDDERLEMLEPVKGSLTESGIGEVSF